METSRIPLTSDDIQCSLCNNRYTDPRILPCLHSFCHQCLLGVASKKDQDFIIQCPICKKVHQTTETQFGQLPTNVHMLGLIQLHNVKSIKGRKCLVCQLSKSVSDATHLCLSCDDLLCVTCSKGHNSASVTASHKVVTLVDILKGKFDREIYNNVAICCKQHQGEDYVLYCNDCQSMMCIKCALVDHRNHSHTPLEDVITAKQKSLRECLEQVSPAKDQVSKSIEERIAQIEQNQKEFEHKLNIGVVSVIDQLHREKKEVMERAKKIFAEDKRRLNELKTSLKKSSSLEEMYYLMAIKGGPGLAMMSATLEGGVETLKQSVTVPLPRFVNILPTIEGMSDQNPLITMAENPRESRDMKTREDSDRKLVVKKASPTDTDRMKDNAARTSREDSDLRKSAKEAATTDNDGMKDVPSLKKMVSSEVRGKQSISQITNPSTASLKAAVFLDYETDFIAKVGKDSLQPAINSLSLYAGKLMLVDTNNVKVKVYSSEGRLSSLFSERSSVIPERAFLSKCFVGIRGNELVFYSPTTSELRPLSEIQLVGTSQIYRPVISHYMDDQVLVANLTNNEIMVYDSNGNLRQTRKTHAMAPIVSVQWNKSGKVIMCSWNSAGSVMIESDTGQLLLEVHKLEYGKRLQDWRPVDACMSSLDFIVVADSMRNELSVFNPQGEEVMVLDTREDDFTHPGRLQIDEDDNLFVSGKDGLIVRYKLNCYSVAYTKLTKSS